MTRLGFTLIWIAFASGLLLFMALAWRARKRRDAGLALPELELTGPVLAHHTAVTYVSTTPVGQPFARVAIPGLTYKGRAELTVQTDGVTIEVTGERPVVIPNTLISDVTSAGGRIGKVVERDGLALLCWTAPTSAGEPRELESSFRFDSAEDQLGFADAVTALMNQNTLPTTQSTHTSQENS